MKDKHQQVKAFFSVLRNKGYTDAEMGEIIQLLIEQIMEAGDTLERNVVVAESRNLAFQHKTYNDNRGKNETG